MNALTRASGRTAQKQVRAHFAAATTLPLAPLRDGVAALDAPTFAAAVTCAICGKDISHYTEQRRMQHSNRCLDKVDARAGAAQDGAQAAPVAHKPPPARRSTRARKPSGNAARGENDGDGGAAPKRKSSGSCSEPVSRTRGARLTRPPDECTQVGTWSKRRSTSASFAAKTSARAAQRLG